MSLLSLRFSGNSNWDWPSYVKNCSDLNKFQQSINLFSEIIFLRMLERMGQCWKEWDNVGKNGTTFQAFFVPFFPTPLYWLFPGIWFISKCKKSLIFLETRSFWALFGVTRTSICNCQVDTGLWQCIVCIRVKNRLNWVLEDSEDDDDDDGLATNDEDDF